MQATSRSVLLAALGAFATFAPASMARAWCQSANVQAPTGSCMQRCPERRDAGDGPFVRLAWDDRDLTWQLQRDGSRDVPRDVVIAVVDRSFFRWTNVTCGEHALDFAVSFDSRPNDDPVAVHTVVGPNENQVLFDDAWSAHDHDPAAYALTTTHFWIPTGEILGADVELNEEHWTFTTCPPAGCADGRVDLENVITHELGHFFGLAHTPDDSDATMWACSSPGDVHLRDLEDDDVAGICALYGAHLEGGCGCAAPGAVGDERGWLVGLALGGVVVARRRRRR